MIQIAALAIGATFLLVAVHGFVPGITTGAPLASSQAAVPTAELAAPCAPELRAPLAGEG